MPTTPPAQGHNSQVMLADVVKQYVRRLDNLDEEIKGLNDDKREVYAEAKANGLDPRVLKIVMRRRRQDPAERDEADALVATYERALEAPARS